jgi:hypothetical protein
MKTEQEEIIEYNELKTYNKERGFQWELSRTDIINILIKKYGYVNYLEIGVNDGTNIRGVVCEHKDGVDPGIETTNPPEVNYPIGSNDFFDLIKGHGIKYDIIFIDGLHHDYQVLLDIQNALNHLTDNGTIVCHDMNPAWEIVQRKTGVVGTWNGDCWKAWAQLRTELTDYSMEVVDTDHGVGIIRKGEHTLLDNVVTDFWEMDSNRKKILNLISIDEFKEKYD